VNSNFVIANADQADLHQLAVLFNQYRMFYGQDDDLVTATQFIRQRLAKQDSVILICQNNARDIGGFCQLYPTVSSLAAASSFVLNDLFVSTTMRRMGLGKALLLAAHEYTKRAGASRMVLTTARTNIAAQALYESLGWVRDDDFHVYGLTV